MASRNQDQKLTFKGGTKVISAILQECDEAQNFDDIQALGVDAKSTDQHQTPLFFLAIESELFHVVKFLVKNGVDGEAKDSHGNTILHKLAKCKDIRIIQMVKKVWRELDLGWMPLNDKNFSPIGDGIYQRNESVTQALLDELAPDDFEDQYLVFLAVKKNFLKGLKALIKWQEKNKASPSILIKGLTKTPLEEALCQRHSEMLSCLLYTDDVCQNWDQNQNLVPCLALCGKLEMIERVWPRLTEDQKLQYINLVATQENLEMVLKYRPWPRQAQYLRAHLHLAIGNNKVTEAKSILDFCKKNAPKKPEDLQHYYETILLPSDHDLNSLSKCHSNQSPLVMSIARNLPQLITQVLDLEWEFLMLNKTPTDKLKTKAHHTSKTLDPKSLKICLGLGTPPNEILQHYFKYLKQRDTLSQRIHTLQFKEDQNTALRLHRQWAVQIFDLQILHQVTDAIGTLALHQRQQIVCALHNDLESVDMAASCLQFAVSSQKRLFVNELVHQEYLCHPNNEENGTECLRKQLTHDNDIMYTVDTFSSFYPKSFVGKSTSFLVFRLIPCIFGVLLICIDIWQDMELTQEYDRRRNNETNIETAHTYDVAFKIGFSSQFLHLIASVPIWIWNCFTLLKHVLKSGITINLSVSFLVVLAPIVFSCGAFLWGILVTSPNFAFIWMSNAFSATLIICLSFARMVTVGKVVYGTDQKRSQNNEHLHRIERQLVLTTIGESCFEVALQLGLQIWLLSEEPFAHELKESGFLWGSVKILKSIFTTEQNVSVFQGWLIFKLFLSCASLIMSVSRNYRRLRNNSMDFQHLIFIGLSLTCQVLARVSVIINWCLQFKGSLGWQIGGVGAFLLANIIFTSPIHLQKLLDRKLDIAWNWQNILALVLSVLASSILLVRIPQLNRQGEVVVENTLKFQIWYFSTSLLINIIWPVISCIYTTSNEMHFGTFGEILLLFWGGLVFHGLYYTAYGHPWKIIIRKKIWRKIKNLWSLHVKSNALDHEPTQSEAPLIPKRNH